MKTFKMMLMGATALSMVAGVAYAQSNEAIVTQSNSGTGNTGIVDQTASSGGEANLEQEGDGNEATITQSGSGNKAGELNTASHVDTILQYGNENVLMLDQGGSGNSVGIQSSGTGFDQVGDKNTADIDQSGSGNTTFNVRQEGVNGAANTQNSVNIDQSGTDNTIDQVRQISDDGTGAANEATINQSGNDSTVSLAEQTGNGNQLEIQQVGSGDNASITQTGDDNGVGSFDSSRAASIATDPLNSIGYSLGGVQQGLAYQKGDSAANSITYDVFSGSGNLFGFRQVGDGNSITGSQTGMNNEIAVRQEGLWLPIVGSVNATDNIANFTQNGEDNSTGIMQLGDGNVSTVDVSGTHNDAGTIQGGDDNNAELTISEASSSNNILAALQVGVGNDADLSLNGSGNIAGAVQVGSSHEATLDIDGSQNLLVIAQGNAFSGNGNSAVVTINGARNNNAGSLPASFTKSATANAATGFGTIGGNLGIGNPLPGITDRNVLTPGLLAQVGNNNSMTVDVGTAGPASDNLFSAVQYNNGNTLTAEVNGNANEFVAIQSGGETASITQTGFGNAAVVNQ